MKQLTPAQLDLLVTRYKNMERRIADLKKKQDRVLDEIEDQQEFFESRWFWLTRGTESHIKRHKAEAKAVEKYLEALDRAEMKTID